VRDVLCGWLCPRGAGGERTAQNEKGENRPHQVVSSLSSFDRQNDSSQK
jgi:hypothetical protein